MTGRGAGYCGGAVSPGSTTGPGRGVSAGAGFRAAGAGWGRGWRHRFWATGIPGWRWGGLPGAFQANAGVPDNAGLENEVRRLREELDEAKRRLDQVAANAPAGSRP